MKTSNLLLSALFAFTTSAAFALDLSTNVYPTSYLGPKTNIATKATYSANAGAYMCQFAGESDVGSVAFKYAGHTLFIVDGIQDSNGFGHYLSTPGKENFMHVSVINTIQDPNTLAYSNNAVSCVQKLDTTKSKYAVNKYGVGVDELYWLADPSNPLGCPAQIDQMGFVSDKNGNYFHTKFITTPSAPNAVTPSPTNVWANQSVSCMKTGL